MIHSLVVSPLVPPLRGYLNIDTKYFTRLITSDFKNSDYIKAKKIIEKFFPGPEKQLTNFRNGIFFEKYH